MNTLLFERGQAEFALENNGQPSIAIIDEDSLSIPEDRLQERVEELHFKFDALKQYAGAEYDLYNGVRSIGVGTDPFSRTHRPVVLLFRDYEHLDELPIFTASDIDKDILETAIVNKPSVEKHLGRLARSGLRAARYGQITLDTDEIYVTVEDQPNPLRSLGLPRLVEEQTNEFKQAEARLKNLQKALGSQVFTSF